ncbi:MAG: hypothetical protein K9W43_04960 [Candidatus Thorarchaeota archaeon]|nr:hypothetical protein [Candidatus Thorarchaeota archaeon]
MKLRTALLVIAVLSPLWVMPLSAPEIFNVPKGDTNSATHRAFRSSKETVPSENYVPINEILACPVSDSVDAHAENKRKFYNMMDDNSAILFLQTDWKSQIETYSKEWMSNGTKNDASQQNIPTRVPSYRQVRSIWNESHSPSSINVQDTRLSKSKTAGYFSGHTWSWEYGPNDRHVEAPEVVRPLEGNWFPQSSYSRITYQAVISPISKISFRIERGADTYARRIRLYCGNYLLLDDVISSSEQYYEASILTTNIPLGIYFVMMEINYGGYKFRGWNLRYWQVFYCDSEGYYQPTRTAYQQFQKERSSTLEFCVPMGPHTILNLETQNCHDIYTRLLYVYVDDVLKQTLYAPGAYEVEIANFVSPGLHDLKFVLYYGDHFWGYYSKSIRQLCVTYEYKQIEVDSMATHVQPSTVFERVETYYRTHGYRRIVFHVDETNIPYDYELTYNEVNSLYWSHCNHIGQDRWVWGLYGHTVKDAWGWAQFSEQRFVIGDQVSIDFMSGSVSTEDKRVWILTHEFGHTEKMLDFTGYKTDVYTEKQYGFTYVDWYTPHYPSNSWRDRLEWVCSYW